MADSAVSIQSKGAPPPIAYASLSDTLSKERLILVVVSVLLGMLLASIDQTIVGTAMPRIIADLNGLEHYAWVATAYLLASTVAVPIWGKLSDIYGRKIFFIGGMVVFLVGSFLSGLSQTMVQLIIFRALQGLGGGAMMPIALALIADIFPPAERGKWQGLMMAVFGLSSIVGPTAGGWITDNWGWRWTFYVNMPVGAVALLVAILVLPSGGARRKHTIDYLGSLTLIAGAVPLLLAFSWAGTQYAWGSWQIIGLLVLAVVMLVSFHSRRDACARADHHTGTVQEQHLFHLSAGHLYHRRGHVRRHYVPASLRAGRDRQLGHQFGRGNHAHDVWFHV